ncbi:MAG: DegT/DnrJ/EryC1/StrS family aminotransferase [Granulosicoccus sp.]
MLNTPFSPWPNYSEEEVEAVSRVLRSNQVNYWTGEETREFECEFAGFADCSHAIALANGTLALDLALRFLVEPGDEVVVTPRTFIASVSSVVNARARPVFADVDADSQNITAESIEQVLTLRTRAILVVHLAGQPADMDPIMDLANRHNLKVIEDCAQAHGARYKGRSVGSMGHVGAWSFCQDKIMTTAGEGGMVTTNDATLWEKMWAYKDHGKSWDAVYNREHPSGYRWLHESFGTNWRMTEVQACIGRIQLKRMGSWQEKRLANASRIWTVCRGIDWLRVPPSDPNLTHAAYKAYVFVRKDRLPVGWDRDAILEELAANNIPAFSGSCSEVYLEKAFDNAEFRPSKPLPIARELGETSLMFLCHPTLSDSEMVQTCNAIHAVNSRIEREIVA